MRRTVKAWGVLWDGDVFLPSYTRAAKHLAVRGAQEAFSRAVSTKGRGVYPRVVPVTIAFNDGRPAPKRRKRPGAKRRGGRRG